jgi:hypothetical protein
MTAKAVYEVLVEKGWSAESLPTIRTISNILLRQYYRLRTVAKSKVQKNSRNLKSELEQQLQRVTTLHWWDITINPETVTM